MKEFCDDATCCTVKYTESHVLLSKQYTRTEYVWQTKMDTYIQCKAYVGQIYQDYADSLLLAAKKTKRHPGFPKDDNMKLYKLLKTMVEGTGKMRADSLALEASGELTGENRKGVMDGFQHKAKGFITAGAAAAAEAKAEAKADEGDGETKPKPKREPKAKSGSQSG